MRRKRVTFKESEALIKGLSWDASLDGLSWDSAQSGLSWDATAGQPGDAMPSDGLSWDATADVARFIRTLRAETQTPLPDSTVGRLVTAAVTEQRDTMARPAPLGTRRWALLRRRVATLGTSIALALGSTTGVALAADQALPGDQLYGIDVALERIGIGDGGTAERLGEALGLVQRGDVAIGLEHAAESLTGADAVFDGDVDAAVAALSAAAERMLVQHDNPSDAVRADVAALLQYLADNQGHVDGQQVATLAQDIGRSPDEMPESSQRPATPPGQSEEPVPADPSNEPPGQSDEPPGKSDEPPGKSDEAPGQGTPPTTPPGQEGKG